MPRVPTYDGNVQRKALPSARFIDSAPIEAFGGGAALEATGRSFQRVVDSGVDLYETYKLKADKDRVRKSIYETQEFEIEQESKARQRTGESAINVSQDFDKAYQDKLAEIDKSFSNDRQRNLFAERATPLRIGALRRINRFELNETEKYRNQAHNATMESFRKSAVDNYVDPEAVFGSIGLQQQEFIDFNEGKLSPEQKKLGLQDIENRTFTSVIGRMMNSGQGLQAQAYYENIKDQLDGETSAKLGKAIDLAVRDDVAKQTASTLFAESGENLGEALKKLRKTKMDAKTFDETRRRIAQAAKDKKVADDQALDRELETYRDLLFQNGGDMSVIPKERLVELPDDSVKALERRAKNIRDGRDVSDHKTVLRWYEMSPSEMARLEPIEKNEILANLGSDDQKSFVKDVADAKNGRMKDVEDGRTRRQILKDAIALAGIEKNDEEIALFKERWTLEVEQEEDILKRPMRKSELDKLKNQLAYKYDTGFLSSSRGYKLSQEDLLEAAQEEKDSVKRDYLKELAFSEFYRSIDQNVRRRILKSLRENSIPVTNESIRRAYEISLKRNAGN